MFSSNDYAKMTPDELALEAKKLKSQKIIIALFIGALVGIAIWSATHKGGFFLTVCLLISSLFIGSKYSKNIKSIQTEISRRDSVR